MKKSFAPIVDENSKVLILGTIPGDESLRTCQYYVNPRNQFWKLVSTDNDLHLKSYRVKCEYLLNNGIAIWDVLSEGVREGSLDANIRNGKPNDFIALFNQYPNIKYVFFNGSDAEKAFRLFFSTYYKQLQCKRLDSSSGTYAKKLTEKQKVWQIALHSCK